MQHAFVAEDVVVEGFEVFDSVGDAVQVGVDGDGHDAGDGGAFLVEAAELVAAAAEDLVGGLLLDGGDGDVVELDGVGDGDQGAGLGADRDGLVVEHPVGDVFDAELGEEVGGLHGFGQAGGSQPRGEICCAPVVATRVGVLATTLVGVVVPVMAAPVAAVLVVVPVVAPLVAAAPAWPLLPRSCSSKSKPVALPNSSKAGGAKAKTLASLILPKRAWARARWLGPNGMLAQASEEPR